jgi:hypothetical protein
MRYALLLLLLNSEPLFSASVDSSQLYRKRTLIVHSAVIGGTAAVYSGLYGLWYAGYPMQKFHWHNDAREWRGMDKCGHAFSAFQLSNQTYRWYRWSGYAQKKSAGLSAISALCFQNPLEILDGFSSGWGASKADLTANAFGALLSGAQLYRWGENKILLKFSYAPTNYAALRPAVLGANPAERLMKDYNGQTYWLSAGLKDLLGPGSKFPGWLNLALGYGANGMLGGYRNSWTDQQGMLQNRMDIARSSQWYLSPDIRFSRIPVRKKGMKEFFSLLDMIKIPLPGLMLQEGNIRVLPLSF